MNILNSEMPFDEIIIINQLHNGEEKAYQYLYDTYYATLCTFANSLVHDAFWAEAIVGDVFFNMWLKRRFVIHQKLSKRLSHAVGSQSLYRYSTLRTK